MNNSSSVICGFLVHKVNCLVEHRSCDPVTGESTSNFLREGVKIFVGDRLIHSCTVEEYRYMLQSKKIDGLEIFFVPFAEDRFILGRKIATCHGSKGLTHDVIPMDIPEDVTNFARNAHLPQSFIQFVLLFASGFEVALPWH